MTIHENVVKKIMKYISTYIKSPQNKKKKNMNKKNNLMYNKIKQNKKKNMFFSQKRNAETL